VKSKKDPRHVHRLKTMRSVFAWQFQTPNKQTSLSATKRAKPSNVGATLAVARFGKNKDFSAIIKNIKKIDKIIKDSAPKWPLEQINKVDLAILRTACWELLHKPKTPTKVIIDEAIELAKEFSAQTSASFINGVLGTGLSKIRPNNKRTRSPPLEEHEKNKTTRKKTKN